jgi:glycosyltransferase involved in cell wall biosynthesis
MRARTQTGRPRRPTAKSPRKVLMIAYAFPPTGGPGVQRPAKFAKYLPQFGWRPIVWTTDYVEGLPVDRSLRDELPPEVEIHQPPPIRKALTAARRALAGVASFAVPAAARRFTEAVEWRLAARRGRNELADASIIWCRRSVRPLLELVDRERPDVIFSTYSPASNHRLGLELKRRFGLPWVADFRDLWIDDCRYREPSPARRATHAKLQREILEQADVVVAVSPRQTEVLASHLPGGRSKFVTITNGFDPDDFADAASLHPTRNGLFTIAYAGRLDRARARPGLIDGLRRFGSQASAAGSRVLLRIAGHAGQWLLDQLRESRLELKFDGYVSHRDAIGTMASADVLLLPMPCGKNGETIISGKVFEYLATGKPILVIGPQNGECERIVLSCDAGVSVPFDADAIATALQTTYEAWHAGRPLRGCSEESLAAFSRVQLTQQLAEVFGRLVGSGAARRVDEPELVGAG